MISNFADSQPVEIGRIVQMAGTKLKLSEENSVFSVWFCSPRFLGTTCGSCVPTWKVWLVKCVFLTKPLVLLQKQLILTVSFNKWFFVDTHTRKYLNPSNLGPLRTTWLLQNLESAHAHEKLIKKTVFVDIFRGKNRNCRRKVTCYSPMDLKIGIHGLQTNTPRRFFRISIFVPHLGEIGSGSRPCPPFVTGRSR